MTEEQWREAWVAFQAAENLPEEEAAELLEQSPMSAEVRDAVVQMLHSGGSATGSRTSGFAHSNPATGPLPAPALSLAAGTVIGRYVLLKKVGEGGMGEVWLAGQKEPVQRQVALKLIKTGSGSRELMARFESERQALALMDHPGIAKVFDAGSTAQGLPYFVMEYAAGEPITTYCDRRRLSTHERLELFIQVCEAVQHAHRKAIIHRDLKPSNIMVVEIEGRPAPKIIDFGIAKAVNQKLSADTIHTGFGALVGTPEYMSPEQAASGGADIDTRTDVYSLGVVFYELLAGARPIDLNPMGLEEFLRRAARRKYARVPVHASAPKMPPLRARWPAVAKPTRRHWPGSYAGIWMPSRSRRWRRTAKGATNRRVPWRGILNATWRARRWKPSRRHRAIVCGSSRRGIAGCWEQRRLCSRC